jgi:ABC-type Zn uptake system ZnuABC Zn-binding protein ZnuA
MRLRIPPLRSVRIAFAAASLLIAALPWAGAPPTHAGLKPLRVVTTTEDLAAIAHEVGGDRVQVITLSRGDQNPHLVKAKPAYIEALSHADVFVEVGRDLEASWAPALVEGARNPRIVPGAPGYVDASAGVRVIEVPAPDSLPPDDEHPRGNPHYWLDPENAKPIAHAIRDALTDVSSMDAGMFRQRTAEFEKRLDAAIGRWKARAASLGLDGMRVVTYHRSWSYFAGAYGLRVVGTIEPRPGVAPSSDQLADLIRTMKRDSVRVLIAEPGLDSRTAQSVSKEAHVPLAVLPSSVGAESGINDYFDLFDRIFARLAKGLNRRS